MKIRIHNPIYGVPITFLDKWRPFEPVYILNPDRYANEYIISPNIKPFSYFCCLIPKQFRIVGMSASAKYRKEIVGLPFIGNENKDDGRPILNGKNTYARIFIQKI